MLFKRKISPQMLEFITQKISWGNWFVFFNSLWAIIIGGRYAFLIDWPKTLLGKCYFFISLIGHFSFIAFAVYLLLVFPLAFLIKNQRTYRGISVVIYTIGISILMVDTEVFKNFHFHLSNLIWNLVANPENGELARQWQIFFAPMPFILLVQMVFSRWSWYKLRSLERQKWLKWVALFYMLMFLTTHLIYAWSDAYGYRPVVMQKYNFPLSYPMTARKFLERRGLLQNTALDPATEYFSLKLDYPKHPLSIPSTPNSPQNILIINLTGLSNEDLDSKELPNLSKFFANALRFKNNYSASDLENAGIFSLLYGLLPQYLPQIESRNIPSELWKILQQQHYSICYMGNPVANLNNWQDLDRCGNELPANPWFILVNMQFPTTSNANKSELDNLLSQWLANVDLTTTTIILTSVMNKGKGYYINKSPLLLLSPNTQSQEIDYLTSTLDILPTLMQNILKVQNSPSDYSQGENLAHANHPSVMAQSPSVDIIILPNGSQYHINHNGEYKQYNTQGEEMPADSPSLGLLLNIYKNAGSFWDK